MGTFTDTITVTAITDDGRTLTLSNSYSIADIEQSFEYSGYGSDPTVTFPAGGGEQPAMDQDPILLVISYLGNGEGDIIVTNDDASAEAAFSIRKGQTVTIHGTEPFLADALGTATSIGTAYEQVMCQQAQGIGPYRIIALFGPTS